MLILMLWWVPHTQISNHVPIGLCKGVDTQEDGRVDNYMSVMMLAGMDKILINVKLSPGIKLMHFYYPFWTIYSMEK